MFSYKYGVRSIAVELPKYLKDDPAISHEKLKVGGSVFVKGRSYSNQVIITFVTHAPSKCGGV